MLDLPVIILFVLGVVAVIDLMFKKIPAIFLTGIIFLIGMVQFYEFTNAMFHLSLGIMAFVFAWMLYEGEFIGGVADIKVLVIIGLLIKSVPSFFAFVLITLLIGMAYKLIILKILKKDQKEEIPFIPALYCVYVVLFLINGI